MTVIAAVRSGPVPESADVVYLPVEEGVNGRDDAVTAIAVFHSDALPPLDRAEAYRVDEHVQWDRGGATVARISFVRRAPGMAHEEFARHWTEVHTPLARAPSSTSAPAGACSPDLHVLASLFPPQRGESDAKALAYGFSAPTTHMAKNWEPPP